MKNEAEKVLKLLHHRRNSRKVRRVARFCRRRLFSGCFPRLEVEGIEGVLDLVRNGRRVVFIPNHQSEYDWVILQTVLVENDVKAAIQAGDNLFIGPLDPFLRHCGAFMTIRNERAFYSSRWYSGWLLKLLGRKPVIVTREMYGKLYLRQLQKVLGEDGLHLIVFPGYDTDPYSGEVKLGRSYSGSLNPLSPIVFAGIARAVQGIPECSDAVYVPVNVSYERVPEDILFREYKARTRRSKIAKYVYDHYYTFLKAPLSRAVRRRQTRVVLMFGKAIPVKNGLRAREMAHRMHHELGRLMRVYESQVLFHSIENRFRLSKSDLEQRVLEVIRKVEDEGLDTSPLYDSEGHIRSIDEMLGRLARIFNIPRIPIIPSKSYMTIEYDDHEVFVHHPHLASYYANKLEHLFQDSPQATKKALDT